jgi:hypothetical protein
MHLFTRSTRLAGGDVTGQLSWVGSITEEACNTTGLAIDAWATVMSPDANTIVWACWVEHLSEIEQAGDKLAASDAYLRAIAAGEAFTDGSTTDGLASVVHNPPTLDDAVPAYVTVATAVAAPGRLSDAVAAGVEIAEHATRLSGLNTMFLVNSTGAYGGCSWITGAADIDTVERGEGALMGDPAWLQLLDRVGTAFNADASQSIYRRIT